MAEKSGKHELVEVTWSGKKLFLDRAMLEEWYNQSFEEHDEYVKKHPWCVQADVYRMPQPTPKEEEPEPEKKPEVPEQSQFVVVHFGNKSVLLKREYLEDWYNTNAESKKEWLENHPDVEVLSS